MCGFAGWFDLGPAAGPAPSAAARRAALDSLADRGPDGEGVATAPHFGLLHRRLAVVDVKGGAQPMRGPRAGQWLAWNGELFDHAARRKALAAAGEDFVTRSDTEVVARLLAREGAETLPGLRAQYALAWIDGDALLLARDRCGEKPLFWRSEGDRVWFASTLDALAALAPFSRELDREAVSLYLSWGFVPAPRTIYAGVRKLAAGEWLRIERGGRLATGRVAPPAPLERLDDDDCAPALQEALAEASRLRLASADVPVGVFLSGGLDSIAVAACLRGAKGVRAFTVRSRDRKSDESRDARRVAAALGIEHEVIEAPRAAPGAWRDAILRHGEPFAASSGVAIDGMARAAARHVKVVLTGDGGDEALGGYDRHRILRGLAKLPRMPDIPIPKTGALRRVARAYELASLAPADRYAAMYEVFGRWRAQVTPGDDGAAARSLIRQTWGDAGAGDLAAMLRVDRTYELPDSHCVKLDVACMGNGVEPRSPWLDPGVQAVCDAMPRRMRTSGRETKRALRELLRAALPPSLAAEVVARKKKGFSTGFDDALRSEETRALLVSGALDRVGGIDARAADAIWRDHARGRGNHRFRLFVLVALALFAEAKLG